MRYLAQSFLHTTLALIVGFLLNRYFDSSAELKNFKLFSTMSGLNAGDSFPDGVQFSYVIEMRPYHAVMTDD
jgi:hypothetical protein